LRRSREAAAETRQKITGVAARQFRKRGIGGIGIADVMDKAGLAHGGSYKHFKSKDVLAAEACGWALAATRNELAAAAPKGQGLEAIVDIYLSTAHRDQLDRGCIIAALAASTSPGYD
jgi:TetR/AcrR family transcriptional repressor of nem operon